MEVFDQPLGSEFYEQSPPDLPPPFEAQLAYSQLVAELGPLVKEPQLDTAEAQEHLHEIIEATEKNEAIEGDLERSHEIMKDQAAAGELASSVGQVLAQIHQSIQLRRESIPQPSLKVLAISPTGRRLTGRLAPMYQRALISGLAGGLIIATIWLLIMWRAA